MYWDKYLEMNKNLSGVGFGYRFLGIIAVIAVISFMISKMRSKDGVTGKPEEKILLALLLISVTVIILVTIGAITNSVSLTSALAIALVFLVPTGVLLLYQRRDGRKGRTNRKPK